jgi:hypothetical protein
MRTQWYGDKRDLVKWATLFHLCRKHSIKTIIQIPFLPKENGCEHRLEIDGESVDFPREVWQHFRDLDHVKELEGMNIEVLRHEFSHRARQVYWNEVKLRLGQIGEPKIVFLDPDTGIEPGKAGRKHVLRSETPKCGAY